MDPDIDKIEVYDNPISEMIKKIKKLERKICYANYITVERRAFWILCYCYFINGKNEPIYWRRLEEINLMASETLWVHLSTLVTHNFIREIKIGSRERPNYYKLTAKAKHLIEQQLSDAEILLQLRGTH